MLVFRYRQKQRLYETVISAIDLSSPAQAKFYESTLADYKQAMFPYVNRAVQDERERTKSLMDRAFLKGSIKLFNGSIVEE